MKRPSSMPDSALWDERSQSWLQGALDENGRRHGNWQGYRQGGSLQSQMCYAAGQLTGTSRRYHPNGELAEQASYVEGKLEGELQRHVSSEPTPERLRSCCIPPGSFSLVEHYTAGRCTSQAFFDQENRRLLDDGSLHPDRPGSVPAEARFIVSEQRWEMGSRGQSGRQGLWQWWALGGALSEAGQFEDGKLHGAYERHDAQGEVYRGQYSQGLRHGSFVQRATPGEFKDATIASWHGEFEKGLAAGCWQWQTQTGAVLFERDLGRASPESSSHLTLTPQQETLFEASLAAHPKGGSQSDLLTPDASIKRIQRIRKSQEPARSKVAALLSELQQGVQASLLFQELATQLLPFPHLAIRFADGALALDPKAARGLRALILLDLGRLGDARQDIAELMRYASDAGAHLQNQIALHFPTFDFWPTRLKLARTLVPGQPEQVEQDLLTLQQAISKAALRLRRVREALVDKVGQAPWLPPALAELELRPDVKLDSYRFELCDDEAEDSKNTEVINVNEELDVANLEVLALMGLARIEWQALCWLCYAAGLEQVCVPVRQKPPADFPFALATALTHALRIRDQLETRGLRSRRQGLAAFDWGGRSIEALTSNELIQARGEILEMRAALFFAADPSCRSLWQDDLRV